MFNNTHIHLIKYKDHEKIHHKYTYKCNTTIEVIHSLKTCNFSC